MFPAQWSLTLYPVTSVKWFFLALFSALQYSFLHYEPRVFCSFFLIISCLLNFNGKMKLNKGNTQLELKCDSNAIRTHNHLVHKEHSNHSGKFG